MNEKIYYKCSNIVIFVAVLIGITCIPEYSFDMNNFVIGFMTAFILHALVDILNEYRKL